MLKYVKDTAVAVPPDHYPYDFGNYGDREEDNDRPTIDLSEMFYELGFAKLVNIWCNPEAIPSLQPNDLVQKLEHLEPIESPSS